MLSEFDVMPTLPTADLGAAKAFYEGLGFAKAESDIPAEAEEAMGALYSAGATKFLVYPSAYAGTNKATAMAFSLGADEFDSVVAALKAKGVTFDTFEVPDGTWDKGVLSGYGMRSVWFHDPDGNIVNVGTEA
jgi:catechol 2,3-dioxygenase-like lactoylglutathione lyase family enzyme